MWSHWQIPAPAHNLELSNPFGIISYNPWRDCLCNQFQQVLLFLLLSLIIHEWPTWFAVDLQWLPINIRKCSTSAKIRNITMNSYIFFCSISKKSSHYQNASNRISMTHENPAKSCRLLQTIGMWICQLHNNCTTLPWTCTCHCH